MKLTPIEWTDFSANPLKYRDQAGNVVWGCVHASPGCINCYAEQLAHRYNRGNDFTAANMRGLTPFLDDRELRQMLTAKVVDKRPVAGSKCFPFDMTDLFGEWVPDDLIDRVFAVFALRGSVEWQVLTKRADRMRQYFADTETRKKAILAHALTVARDWDWDRGLLATAFELEELWKAHRYWPLPNVWLGVSVEDQRRANARIPQLMQTDAAVRFISAEPLLEPVNLSAIRWETEGSGGPAYVDVCRGTFSTLGGHGLKGPRLDWVIVGGESGNEARACDVGAVRRIVDLCRTASVPVFVKQLGALPFEYVGGTGEWRGELRAYRNSLPAMDAISVSQQGRMVNTIANLEIKSRKGGDPAEWSEDLRVRQFPVARS